MRRYIESGAEIPSRPRALASVIRAADDECETRRRPLRVVGVDDPGVAVEARGTSVASSVA